MRFYADDPTKITEVQWYFVPEDGPWLGRSYSFGSLTWDKKDGIPEPSIGEVYHPQPYANGRPPYCVRPGGICGTVDQWINGALTTDPVPPDYPDTQIPECCTCLCPVERGGNAIGGTATAELALFTGVAGNANGGTGSAVGIPRNCAACLSTPLQVQIAIAGFTGSFASYNGTYVLTQAEAACIWRVNTAFGNMSLQFLGALPYWQVFLVQSAGPYAEWQETGPPYQCVTAMAFPLLNNHISADTPTAFVTPL
jgi:hypothetical protein